MNDVQSEILEKNCQVIFEKTAVAPPKKCSNCGSVFITDVACDSCGYQFRFDWVGHPLGANSLYSLQEQYVENFTKWQKKFSFLVSENSNLTQAYKRKLLKRFESLLLYLSKKSSESDDENRVNLFLMEVKDLAAEMINLGIAYENIVKILKTIDDELLVKSVYHWLHTIDHQRHKFSLLDFIFYYRILGSVRISFLVLFLGGVILTSSLALALY